jgi:hypothetical protein
MPLHLVNHTDVLHGASVGLGCGGGDLLIMIPVGRAMAEAVPAAGTTAQ